MLRQLRIDTTGALHHIIARGIDRRKIFEDDPDRYDFLKNLDLILEQTETACCVGSLIPNHFISCWNRSGSHCHGERVSTRLDIPVEDIWREGKFKHLVRARSLLCFWRYVSWA